MAHKSLLRYIFRHGPNSKARTSTPPKSGSHTSANTKISFKEPNAPPKYAAPGDGPESPLAYKSRSESRQSSVLEDIEEESISGNETNSSDVDKASITDILAALDLDIDTFTTRGLITASVDEARMGNYAHLDTINTFLALLESLNGFSETIDVLRVEMEGKKHVCEEKLAMLEGVCRTVAQLQFGAKEDGMNSEEEQ
ncbi:hypothetical protein CC86DRAFT_432453 [Ophiobolus disseminans]|uniref:Uncharacterized protein n=1 Tax=Ophiobolus disseminans TaxID=1469910 RepID=A0A6A6ZDD3_9PLEO|nr:hypothetical protein CC86DRAFT_432453 [Ophiobolus disseminans]